MDFIISSKATGVCGLGNTPGNWAHREPGATRRAGGLIQSRAFLDPGSRKLGVG
jgi:hypothetical protein